MKPEKLTLFSKLLDRDVISAIDFEFCRFLLDVNPNADEHVLHAACITSLGYRNGNVCIALEDYAGKALFKEISDDRSPSAPSLDEWRLVLEQSSLVGAPGDFKPLILDTANRLYLHKLWHFEQNLVRQITEKIDHAAPKIDRDLLQDSISRLFDEESLKNLSVIANGVRQSPFSIKEWGLLRKLAMTDSSMVSFTKAPDESDNRVDWQKVAAIAAVKNLFTVISGGPGTGKTTTVVRLLALLIEQGRAANAIPAIALAAPTGKAAARLETSVRDTKDELQVEDDIREAIPAEAVTLHQLLGARRNSTKFRYNKENPLPYDCVIVDEVSMVDQALMNRLMDALLPDSRLLLLGDKDQLASVEAGSILGDICSDNHENALSPEMAKYLEPHSIKVPEWNITNHPKRLTDHIILLQKSYRFDHKSGIGQLASAVNSGREQEAIKLLMDDEYADITIHSFDEYEKFQESLFHRIQYQFRQVQSAESVREKLVAYQKFKILAAHRGGPFGVTHINNLMEQRLQQEGIISPYNRWYNGRPVIINANDYALGLSNGDLGVCMMEDGQPVLCFEDDEDVIKLSPSRLPAHSTAFALTVHKSQGSEFEEICLVLPDRSSKILSRELLYTAITRARMKVEVIGGGEVISEAIQKKIARNSGLQDYFWE